MNSLVESKSTTKNVHKRTPEFLRSILIPNKTLFNVQYTYLKLILSSFIEYRMLLKLNICTIGGTAQVQMKITSSQLFWQMFLEWLKWFFLWGNFNHKHFLSSLLPWPQKRKCLKEKNLSYYLDLRVL